MSPAAACQCVDEYTRAFRSLLRASQRPCAVCATSAAFAEIVVRDLRSPVFALEKIVTLLSGRAYVERYRSALPSSLPSDFLGLDFAAVLSAGHPCPAELAPAAALTDCLLLHLLSGDATSWRDQVLDTQCPLLCPMCQTCTQSLSGPQPRIPSKALCNGNFCLPLPPQLRDLTFAECLFIARGYTVRRLHTLPTRGPPEARQKATTGNNVAFPQNSASIFATLSPTPSDVAELLTVFFTDASLQYLRVAPAYQVRRAKVEAALQWLCLHNPFHADLRIDATSLHLLPACGVPDEFMTLVNSHATDAVVAAAGPAEALVQAPDTADAVQMPIAAAVVDVEGEALAPAQLWQQALSPGDGADAEACVIVPHGDTLLNSFEPAFWSFCFPHLFPYGDNLPGQDRPVYLPDRAWARHLLRRADRTSALPSPATQPATDAATASAPVPETPTACPASSTTFPCCLDMDFLSVLFSVFHRRDLLHAVRAKLSSPGFAQTVESLNRVNAVDLAAVHAALGQQGTLQDALRSPLVPAHVKQTLRSMQLVSSTVACTDGARRVMRHQALALQIYYGLPALFLTLNPNDAHHPFTVRFANGSALQVPGDADDFDRALAERMKLVDVPRLVAVDPVAATRAFHHHVTELLRRLLCCHASIDDVGPDGFACANVHGILGPVAAFYGVTEPQLRGSLHVHMLVHLYACPSPHVLETRLRETLPRLQADLLAWATSLSATALEQLPEAWNEPQSQATFMQMKPLPYSAAQKRKLEEQLDHEWSWARVENSWFLGDPTAECTPHSQSSTGTTSLSDTYLHWPHKMLLSNPCPAADSFAPGDFVPLNETWLTCLLFDLRATAVRCCLHDCRPKTCYQGFLGKRGFCRMGYWHWQSLGAETGFDWQRCHGHALQPTPRWARCRRCVA